MNATITKPTNTIPQRLSTCESRLIDLTNYYTEALDDNIHHKPGNTLDELTAGIQIIGGSDFDVRGVVQLAGNRSKEITTLDYPKEIKNIPVNHTASKISFLHASAWNIESDAVMIGAYIIDYTDNTTETIQLVYKRNIWDWWSNPYDSNPPAAWTGNNARTKAIGEQIRLFVMEWENPHVNKQIKSISLKSTCLGPGPMVAGISLSI